MRFTMNRTLQFYYAFAIAIAIGLFAFGANYFWSQGPLNVEYVSALYEGTSLVDGVKKRNDIEELKKYVDGDRIKDAIELIAKFEEDIQELQKIKAIDEKSDFNTNFQKVKASVSSMSTQPELSSILTSVSGKISQFESFVTEKRWPTLSKMAINLRVKTNPNKAITGGMYNFDRASSLIASINNDLEAMSNFTQSTGLQADIKMAILSRIQNLKNEAEKLNVYMDEHKKFNRIYADFNKDYQKWFKQVEPEIALRKLQFEKNSQMIIYSLAFFLLGGVLAFGGGFYLYKVTTRRIAKVTEKKFIDLISHSMLPTEGKLTEVFSSEFVSEFEKFRDFIHKRMTYGSIFQEAIPFPSILMDSNFNVIWANQHFYKTWKLDNFDEKSESLTWDFVQRFTNLDDTSTLLNSLRMNHAGIVPIQVRPAQSEEGGQPFEMHISPVEHANQKRILILFYPLTAIEENLSIQKNAILEPTLFALDSILNDRFTPNFQEKVKAELDFAGAKDIYENLKKVSDSKLQERSELNSEIERLDNILSRTLNTMSLMRKNLIENLESQRTSVEKFSVLKSSFATLLDTRDQLEEQMRLLSLNSKELFKDQSKILNSIDNSEKMVTDYGKSMKLISSTKAQFKTIRSDAEEFRMRMIQILDQLLIFQSQEPDQVKMEQFLGKMKFEIKAFDKVLIELNDLSKELDVQISKVEMMNESRTVLDIETMKTRFDQVKAGFENLQFSVSKTSQISHLKDDEMVTTLKALVGNQKAEMRRNDELCALSGMTPDHVKMIADAPRQV